MAGFVSLDKVVQEPTRGLTYKGIRYPLKTISVGTLIKLNKVFQAEEQDLDLMINILSECFDGFTREMCLELDTDQLGKVAQLVTASFEEVEEDDGKKDQTD